MVLTTRERCRIAVIGLFFASCVALLVAWTASLNTAWTSYSIPLHTELVNETLCEVQGLVEFSLHQTSTCWTVTVHTNASAHTCHTTPSILDSGISWCLAAMVLLIVALVTAFTLVAETCLRLFWLATFGHHLLKRMVVAAACVCLVVGAQILFQAPCMESWLDREELWGQGRLGTHNH